MQMLKTIGAEKQLDSLGLSQKEVEASRMKYGTNDFTHQGRRSFLRQYLESFGDPIIKILLIALAVNLLVTLKHQNWFETIGIAAAVFLATFVSTVSEYGSESAFIRLQEEAARLSCRVRRKEGITIVPISEIVVGDLVLLQAGERIPADGFLISGNLNLDQSAINGESAEVAKIPLRTSETEWSPEAKNQLFRGTVVTGGEGVMEVKKVGDNTLYGSLARELQTDTVESPMKVRLAALAKNISRLGYTASILIALADLFHVIVMENQYQIPLMLAELSNPSLMFANLLHAALLAIAVIVVAVPEGLPMMITIVLSSNMLRMQKDHVMVRKLVGIEAAGSINILFTDKTGTLTTGKMTADRIVLGDETIYRHMKDCTHRELRRLLGLSCCYNNSADYIKGKVIGSNSTDRSVFEFALPIFSELAGYRKVSMQPFDSVSKYSYAHVSGEKELILIKGAPEKLLPRCKSFYTSAGIRCQSAPQVKSAMKEMTDKSMRVLVLAVADSIHSPETCDLTFLGLLGMRDSVRLGVNQSVDLVKGAGIQTVMITGDNKETAIAIAKETGIIASDRDLVFQSSELGEMSDQKLRQLLPHLRVVARALPSDKSRLVRLAQEVGLVVGMTGDGINDAPALRKADVGFAMGSGTEVTKEASDIVILDNNFASITKAILYGRTIFKSIRKFIVFQLTMNLCAVGISLISPFIGVNSPVTVTQMLWINMIMDTLAGLAFAGESPQKEYMKEPPKSRNESIINRTMMGQIVITGCYTILLCTAFLKMDCFRDLFHYSENYIVFMTAFFTLFVFSGIFNAFNARTHRINLFAHLRENRVFCITMAAISCVQFLLIFFGNDVFRTHPMPTGEIIQILLLSFTVIPFDFCRKIALRIKNKSLSVPSSYLSSLQPKQKKSARC